METKPYEDRLVHRADRGCSPEEALQVLRNAVVRIFSGDLPAKDEVHYYSCTRTTGTTKISMFVHRYIEAFVTRNYDFIVGIYCNKPIHLTISGCQMLEKPHPAKTWMLPFPIPILSLAFARVSIQPADGGTFDEDVQLICINMDQDVRAVFTNLEIMYELGERTVGITQFGQMLKPYYAFDDFRIPYMAPRDTCRLVIPNMKKLTNVTCGIDWTHPNCWMTVYSPELCEKARTSFVKGHLAAKLLAEYIALLDC